jgi:serine/threonine protein kinase
METIKVILKRKHDPEILKLKCSSLLKLKELEAGEAMSSGAEPFNIVAKIYDVVDTDKKIYISAEILEGVELQKRVITQGPLKEAQALNIVKTLASLLRVYQSKGMIYSDLRGEKLILGAEHPDKIDFKVVDNGNSLLTPEGRIGPELFKKIYPKVGNLSYSRTIHTWHQRSKAKATQHLLRSGVLDSYFTSLSHRNSLMMALETRELLMELSSSRASSGIRYLLLPRS